MGRVGGSILVRMLRVLHIHVLSVYCLSQARDELEYEVEVPPPLNLNELPESLAATLQHIVGQLDVLTQVRVAAWVSKRACGWVAGSSCRGFHPCWLFLQYLGTRAPHSGVG